ncbi:hypothetical protein ACRJ4B_03445 [Streptomyces sp. GTA36]
MRHATEGAVDSSAYETIDFSRAARPVRSGDLDHRPRVTGHPPLYPALDGLLGERRERGQYGGSEQHRKARGAQYQAMVRGSTHCGRRTSPAQLAGLPPYDPPQYGSVPPGPAIVRIDPARRSCPTGTRSVPNRA